MPHGTREPASELPSATAADARPGLLILANTIAPYRVTLHHRIAREIPQFALHSAFTHGNAEFAWSVEVPKEIGAVWFDENGESPLESTWRHPRRDYRKGGAVIRYMREHNVQAVVAHGYNYLTHLRVIRYCHRRGIPVFLRGDSNIRDDVQPSRLKAALKRLYLRIVLRQLDGILPVGTLGEQYFLKYGATPEQMHRVTFEPDYDFYGQVDAGELEAFRQEKGLLEGRRYFIFAGRLASVKRVDLLIDAFQTLASDRPDWDLLIAGDGPLREELKARLTPEFAERVHWLGFLEAAQVRLAYHAADVMVLPSEKEPYALVVPEAMAAGLVVVSSDVVGAAYDLVPDQKSGRIFASRDLQGLIDALADVSDPEKYDVYRAEVGPVLEAFRRDWDPVEGLRQALRSVGLLSGDASLRCRYILG